MSQFKYFPVTFNKFILSVICITTFQGMKNSHFHVQLHHVFDPQFTFDFRISKELTVFFRTLTQSGEKKWHVYNSLKKCTEHVLKIFNKINHCQTQTPPQTIPMHMPQPPFPSKHHLSFSNYLINRYTSSFLSHHFASITHFPSQMCVI